MVSGQPKIQQPPNNATVNCCPLSSAIQFLPLAGVYDLCRIDGIVVDLFFQNLAVLAYQKIHSPRSFVFVHVDPILPRDVAAPVAEQGEGDSNLIGEGFVGEGTVHAHTQDLGVGGLQLFKILLEGLHLGSSTTGKGKDIKRKYDVALAAILTQGDIFEIGAIKILEFEVRRDIADP